MVWNFSPHKNTAALPKYKRKRSSFCIYMTACKPCLISSEKLLLSIIGLTDYIYDLSVINVIISHFFRKVRKK